MLSLKTKSRTALVVSFIIFLCASAVAQVSAAQYPHASSTPSNAKLLKTIELMQQQIHELQAAVSELRAKSGNEPRPIETSRRDSQPAKQSSHASIPAGQQTADDSSYAPIPATDPQGATAEPPSFEEQLRLLAGKVNDQYQTKVESGSKYRVKLSGMILLNMFNNRGTVDSIDVPGVAVPLSPLFGTGSFGGTLRQSQIGIEVFGPQWMGAKIGGDLRFDFAGGFPDESNAVSLGIMRLRTGTIHFDWPATSIVTGQDAPFFSPLSPTSIAQVAEPPLSYSGNLWTWMPQARIEHRFDISEKQSVRLQAGILDPLTGEPPRSQSERLPQAGEISRQPGYATRIAWKHGRGDNEITVGVGGYYNRQDWGFGRSVDGWAGTADWDIPLPGKLEVSGEFYRGRGLGGLGAAIYNSVLSTGVLDDSTTRVKGLDVIGGWTQVKFRATPTLQFNAAYGQDNPYSSSLRAFSASRNFLDPQLGRNRAMMFNFIYRPKSNLLFSTEYRHIDSVRLNHDHLSAEHVNLSVGVLF